MPNFKLGYSTRPKIANPAKTHPPTRTPPQIIGDDLLCTNPKRITRAIESKACNGLLLKVNQVGAVWFMCS